MSSTTNKEACAALARERVRDGAAFLDQKVPGWAGKITRPIDVNNQHRCPLGQIFGSYFTGLMSLGLDQATQQEVALGFQGYGSEILNSIALVNHYYAELSLAWEEERKARLD